MSKLFIVPTPIGNLEDMTFRAIRVLKEADLILAEDTRTSKPLMLHFDINTPLQSYHLFNEHQKVGDYINLIKNGKNLALISDAGTPAISDPGFLLVRECVKNDIEVECLPGATAFVPALVNSALPCERFIFEGFLPAKKGRQTKLGQLKNSDATMIFYESPHRLIKTLENFISVFGSDRRASISREISKKFEETKRGTLSELYEYFKSKEIRGEFVIVVGSPKNEEIKNKIL
jgi:16S rRNA (cytidine1402-2'-O)-methyltransferase